MIWKFENPILSSIYLVALCISTVGFAMGILDTAGNVFVLNLWNGKGEAKEQKSQKIL